MTSELGIALLFGLLVAMFMHKLMQIERNTRKDKEDKDADH